MMLCSPLSERDCERKADLDESDLHVTELEELLCATNTPAGLLETFLFVLFHTTSVKWRRIASVEPCKCPSQAVAGGNRRHRARMRQRDVQASLERSEQEAGLLSRLRRNGGVCISPWSHTTGLSLADILKYYVNADICQPGHSAQQSGAAAPKPRDS